MTSSVSVKSEEETRDIPVVPASGLDATPKKATKTRTARATVPLSVDAAAVESTSSAPGAPTPASPADVTSASRPRRPVLISIGVSVCVLAVLSGSLLVYLFLLSGVQEHHAQVTLRKTFNGQLAGGVAPTAPTAPGRPVAELTIPAIGLSAVVVEGTTAGELMSGPGHERDSVLPGQAGVSVILGRRSTFGSPFAKLPTLRVGDTITAVTGVGKSTYQVVAVAASRQTLRFTAGHPFNEMLLVTATPSNGASASIVVTAKLTSTAAAPPSSLPDISPAERPLTGDPAAGIQLLLWGEVLVAAVALTTIGYLRWSRPAAALLGAPVLAAVLWTVVENITRLLPNTF